ncbi:hypothetical protein [Flavobacterium sp.]|uniref:hypothetical protein n=1 Tax=Flavobacterium sp. TaxID=239 RepID=UPI0040348396
MRDPFSQKGRRRGYFYGFNGQMKDDEVYGVEGTSYTAEYWQYDSRLGRRWNVDPVVKPWESPYACFKNNPIWHIDVNGDDAEVAPPDISKERAKDRAQRKYDNKLEAFTKKNIGASEADFIYMNIGKKWLDNYKKAINVQANKNTEWPYYERYIKKDNVEGIEKMELTASASLKGDGVQTVQVDVGATSGYLILDMQSFEYPDKWTVVDPETQQEFYSSSKAFAGNRTSGEFGFNLTSGTTLEIKVYPKGGTVNDPIMGTVSSTGSAWTGKLYVSNDKYIRKRMIGTTNYYTHWRKIEKKEQNDDE